MLLESCLLLSLLLISLERSRADVEYGEGFGDSSLVLSNHFVVASVFESSRTDDDRVGVVDVADLKTRV